MYFPDLSTHIIIFTNIYAKFKYSSKYGAFLTGLLLFKKYGTGLDEEAIYLSSLTGLGELIKYGCTTCFDHHYVFPNGSENFIDRQFEAADELGIRFYASRGSMSLVKVPVAFRPMIWFRI